MAETYARCTCGALLPVQEGPTHPYMLSTPACWAGYGQVLAREYENAARWGAHRLCVDAYAAQHPGRDEPSARRSVALHLSRLALRFENGWDTRRIDAAMPFLLALKARAAWLEPPVFDGLTFLHVLGAESDAEHLRAVEEWARSVWENWQAQHEVVLGWFACIEEKTPLIAVRLR